MDPSTNLFAVIMAGGSGTRFWPLSRAERPKQFLPIGTASPLIIETIERISPLVHMDRICVVAGRHHRDWLVKNAPELREESIFIEPCARNTAPCIGLAAVQLAHRDPDAILAILPADHHIGDSVKFRRLIKAATRRAALGEIVTLGITPDRPETGYGYIEMSDNEQLSDDEIAIRTVARFVEKPDRATAQTYLDSGRFLWNSGMFFFSARTILAAFQRHLPALSVALDEISAAIGTDRYEAVLEDQFTKAPSVSIDYGIMEPITQASDESPVRVIEADIGWNDVGHWAALGDFAQSDALGNVQRGDTLVIDGDNNIIYADEGTVATVGVSGLVVVRTSDAVLVCRRDDAQSVRKIVSTLKENGREELL